VPCMGGPEKFQGRGGSTAGVRATQESNGQQWARTGAVLLAVDSKWREHSTRPQRVVAKSGCKSLWLAISKGPGRAN
jgi:hypothetical protein